MLVKSRVEGIGRPVPADLAGLVRPMRASLLVGASRRIGPSASRSSRAEVGGYL
jgi:hypothetical protein